jgi:membrane protein
MEPEELRAITRSTTVFNYKRRLVITETAISWSSHRCSMMGAALAYYSIFSFGPLLVISTAIAGLVFGPDAVHGEIATQVAGLLGSAGAQALETLLGRRTVHTKVSSRRFLALPRCCSPPSVSWPSSRRR